MSATALAPPAAIAPATSGATAVERLRARIGWTALNWIAPALNTTGYGDEARTFLRALDGAGLEPRLVHIGPSGFEPTLPTGRLLRRCLARHWPAAGSLAVYHSTVLPVQPGEGGAVPISRTMFETDSVPASWLPWLRAMRRIWVPSEFHVETFARGGVDPDRLRTLPAGLDFQLYRPAGPALDLRGGRGFAFLSAFDFSDRKGWQVLLDAYVREFAGDDDVTLVLKVATHRMDEPEIARRIERHVATTGVAAGRRPAIVLHGTRLSEADMPALYRGADAYVSPTRGEGWGRPLMEALACGVPVIASRWSGQMAFLDDANAWLVDGRLVRVPPDVDLAEPEQYVGHRWFDPDEDALRGAMRAVRDEPASARRRIAGAPAALAERFGDAAIAERVAELALEALDGA